MPIYKQTTELTKCADWLTAAAGHDIQYVYFGDKEVFSVWATYDGTLPAQYSANGSILADYRIYGVSGGVGDRTENLLDESTFVKGFYQTYGNEIRIDPVSENSPIYRSFRQSFAPGTYTISFGNNVYLARAIVDGVMSENVGANISSYTVTTQTGDIGFSMRRAASSSTPWNNNPTMLTEGSTAPAKYVPYGYEVDMGVSGGGTSTTTQIYIGSDPLGEDEYVSFEEQKIYRMRDGTLTPTDPPVPLPELPTVDGTNIVDYVGQSAAVPNKFVAKYRKEGY